MAEAEEKIIARLEAFGDSARSEIVKGTFGDSPSHPTRRVADAWLAAKDSAKRDAREERTLRLASRANLIAYIAIAITAVFNAKEIKWLVVSVISWLP